MKMGILFFCLTLGLAFAKAEGPSDLFFPLEKNQIQILPQRFEYQLINKDRLRVGNVLVDATQIDFQILPVSTKKNRYKLRFQWPAGLLDRGEIAIKDNSGKGIWFQKLQTAQITLSKEKSLASYETEAEVPSLLKLVQLYPFFRFCVHREEPLTKTYLCSKDLFLQKIKRKDKANGEELIAIVQRDSYRPQSFVEINGQMVGDQGVIYLNSPSEFVSMRALLLSGATLELSTRMKQINFKDVVLSDDEKQILVRAQGSEPLDPSTVEYPNSEEWQTHLDVERPFTYVKGEGDLPLRQEFLIKGKVRKENVKVSITQGSLTRTLRSEHRLTLKANPGLNLVQADKHSKLEKLSGQIYRWTLLDLKKNESNRRYVEVQVEDQKYFAAYELERWPAMDANLRLMIPLWAQANLLYTPDENWGLSAHYDSQFSSSASSDPSLKMLTLAGQYRFTSGVHLREPATALEAYAQNFSLDSTQFTLYGLGLQVEAQSPHFWSRLFPWTFVKLRLPLASSSSDFKVKSSYEAEVSGRAALSPSFYWEMGLRQNKFLFENPEGETQSTKTYFILGSGWTF